MPVHDWTRVDDGTFHGFHTGWITHLSETLNSGLLPPDYYALPEQHLGKPIGDVLGLHPTAPEDPLPPLEGGLLLADAPPRRRTLTIRHISGHRIIALIEIVSPANKDRARHVEDFATKAATALTNGIHRLVVDLFPPGPHDPEGMHGAIRRQLDEEAEPYEVPSDTPLTLAAYAADLDVEVFLEQVKVGAVLPEMPLFLHPERYINVPLEETYEAAFRGMPAYWRGVLEEPSA